MDSYRTIRTLSEGIYSEKRSKFLAFAMPVRLGQINSNELTDILIIVVRYFGGVKLGTSGLIVAYRLAAAEAIAAAEIIEKTVDEDITFMFEYPFMNDVMRIVKEENPQIVSQGFENDCSMTLRIRKDSMPRLKARLEKVTTLRME